MCLNMWVVPPYGAHLKGGATQVCRAPGSVGRTPPCGAHLKVWVALPLWRAPECVGSTPLYLKMWVVPPEDAGSNPLRLKMWVVPPHAPEDVGSTPCDAHLKRGYYPGVART